MNDIALVREFQSGKEQAFNEIVLKYRKGVFLTICGIVGSTEDADDLAQEVFIRAHSALGGFRGESSLYTWLYRIATNLSLNHLRKRRLRTFFGLETEAARMPSNTSADESLDRQELSKQLRKAISELPDKQRTVFILRHFRGLPHAEIAEMLDRDIGTIKANYFHAVRALRDKLGPYVKGTRT